MVYLAQHFANADLGRLMLTEAAFWQEPWRLVTSILPHGDVIHLAFNLYWLWIFGAIVETRFGHVATLAMVVVFAAGSGAAQFATGVGGIGLSGVGYGLFGLLFALSRKDSQLLDVMDDGTAKLFVGWFFFCILLTYADVWAIANVAHGMGAFLGVGTGLFLAKPPHGWPKKKASVPWIGGAGVLLAVAMSIAGAWKFRPHLLIGDDGAHQAAYAGQEAFEAGDYDKALEGYQRAAELAPNNGDYAYNVGVTHARLEDWGAAAAAYERALLIAPANEQYRQAYLAAVLQQARLLMDTDPARAEALLEKLVAEDPNDALVWSQLAVFRQQRGDQAGAKEAMERAKALQAAE